MNAQTLVVALKERISSAARTGRRTKTVPGRMSPGFRSTRRHCAFRGQNHQRMRFAFAFLTCQVLLIGPAVHADVYVWAENAGKSTTFHYQGTLDLIGLTYQGTGKGAANRITSTTVASVLIRSTSVFRPYLGGAGADRYTISRVPNFGTELLSFSDATNDTGTQFGWEPTTLLIASGTPVGVTQVDGSITYPHTLATLVGTPMGFSHNIGNGTFIHMFMMPPTEDMGAIDQVTMSALPLNQTLTGIAQNGGNAGTRDFGNRLFRNRTRFEPQNGATTSVGDRFNNRGREVAASRYRSLEGRLNGDTTISLTPRSSSASHLGGSNPTTTVSSGSVSLNDSSPFLSAEVPAGDTVSGALTGGDSWVLWASTDFGKVELEDLGNNNPGMESNSYSSSIGFEYALNDSLSLGLGWSHLWNDNTLTGGLGSVDVEGDSVVTYATWFRNNFWADALYSYGSSEAEIARSTGLGTTVRATPDIETHQASVNLGYNIGHDGGRVVHGPTFGATYTEGTVDGYTETGDPRSNTRFIEQDFESLITRLGWQVNWQEESTIGLLRPQVRIGYGRENLNRDRNAFGTLVPNVANNNTVFGIGQSTSDPGEGWMELGAGLGVEISENCRLIFDYETQIFRENAKVHYGSAMVRMKF